MRAWTPTTSSTCTTGSRCACPALPEAALLHTKPIEARMRSLYCFDD